MSAIASIGGYKLEIVGLEHSEALKCASCTFILREAVQTEDGHRLCLVCFAFIRRSCSDCTCPTSGIKLNPDSKYHCDVAVRKEIAQLVVKCVNHELGCTWTGPLGVHEREHQYQCKTSCPNNGCSALVPVICLPQHQLECKFREADCGNCFRYMDYQEHLDTYSTKFEHLKRLGLTHQSVQRSVQLNEQLQTLERSRRRTVSPQVNQTLKSLLRRAEDHEQFLVKQQALQGKPREAGDSLASSDKLVQLETKVDGVQRQVALAKVQLAKLEVQLQVALACRFVGSYLWRIPGVRQRRLDAVQEKKPTYLQPSFLYREDQPLEDAISSQLEVATHELEEEEVEREIELKSKLMTRTNELIEALKTSNSELSFQLLEEWKKKYKVASNVAFLELVPLLKLSALSDTSPHPSCHKSSTACRDRNEADQKPDIQLLVKELKDVVDNWKPVGVSLGVPVRKLNTIKLDDPHGGVVNWKLKMFEILLRYRPDASWKDVVQALEENDYNDLAATLREKYLADQTKVRKKVVGTDVQSHTREVVDKPPAAPQIVSDSAIQTVFDKNKPLLAGAVLFLVIMIGFAISPAK